VLSYRQPSFSRVQERNRQRLNEFVRKNKLKVILNSNPLEFTKDEVVLDVAGAMRETLRELVSVFQRIWRYNFG
jgi:hypothetical protein